MSSERSSRVCIVTGGASGMGGATVRRFAATGDRVVIVDRNAALAEQLADELRQTHPACEVIVAAGDVADSSFADQVITDAVARWGRVDVLVNAAGIIVRSVGHTTSDADWHRIMNINAGGTFFFCRAAINAMLAAPARVDASSPRINGSRGAIVNFGSIWGDLGSSGVAAYCASKGAVHNLTRGLAMDHATDGIRINAVCPGEVNTPMLQSERSEPVTDELLAKLASTVPTGRLADPDEVAAVVEFLASDAASYMTGTMVTVDAGFGAR